MIFFCYTNWRLPWSSVWLGTCVCGLANMNKGGFSNICWQKTWNRLDVNNVVWTVMNCRPVRFQHACQYCTSAYHKSPALWSEHYLPSLNWQKQEHSHPPAKQVRSPHVFQTQQTTFTASEPPRIRPLPCRRIISVLASITRSLLFG